MRLSELRGGSRKSEKDAGLGLSGGGAAPFSPVSSSTASVKLFALAVPVPFVSPDSQAVVPFPTVFLSGAGKLLAPSLKKRNKVGLVGSVYLFLGVIHKISTPFSGLYHAAWYGSVSAPAARLLRIF